MTELFLKIEEAEIIGDEITDLREALIELTKHPKAAYALLDALQAATRAENTLWQDIERREDFKAQFADRDSARIAFLGEVFAKS